MKVEKLVKGYKARKFERAFEEICVKELRENNIHGKILKFADTEYDDMREIRWEIQVGSSEECEDIEDLLEGLLPVNVDIVLCDNCIVSLVYVWYIEEIDKVFEAEKEYVSLTETALESTVGGDEDKKLLSESYSWCNTEVIYF